MQANVTALLISSLGSKMRQVPGYLNTTVPSFPPGCAVYIISWNVESTSTVRVQAQHTRKAHKGCVSLPAEKESRP